MKWLNLLFLGLMCCLCAACLTQALPQVVQPTLIQPPAVEVTQTAQKGFQYYAAVYQQWIILGVYVLTTLIMAFYTSKQDKKKAQDVKKVADTLLLGRRGKPGMLFRLFRLFSRGSRK